MVSVVRLLRSSLFSFAAAALLSGVAGVAHAQQPPPPAPPPNGPIPTPIPLYPHGVPGALGSRPADVPVLYPFLPNAPAGSPRTAVLVIPGGGYMHVALGHEGFQLAEWLNAQGIAAFVLDYRVAPYHYPAEIEDGVTAMRMIRAGAAKDNIDPDRIGVWGSSAGGHLAAILATECHVSDQPSSDMAGVQCQPNFAILAYPVIAMDPPLAHMGSRMGLLGPNPDPALVQKMSPQDAVTADAPPTFIFATTNDPVVPVGNSVAMYSALHAKGVPVEMHLFDFSNHGCGLCGDTPYLAGWPMLLRSWLIKQGDLAPNAPPAPPPAQNMQDWPSGIDGPGH